MGVDVGKSYGVSIYRWTLLLAIFKNPRDAVQFKKGQGVGEELRKR